MKSNTFLFISAVLFASIGQVSSDIYLPSLPHISRALNTTSHLTQLTVFIYMIGYSISRLVYGIVSDAYGRRTPLIIALLSCVVGSIICAIAPSILILILGRLLQGLGGGGGGVIAGAMLRDKLEGSSLARMFSYLGSINIIIIACAPLVGGYLQTFFNWRAPFIFLFFYCLLALIVCVIFFVETNVYQSLENVKLKKLLSNLMQLLSNRDFVIYGVLVFLVYGGILAWLTLGPLLLENHVGITAAQFGWIALLIGACFALSSFINGCLIDRFESLQLLRFGIFLLITAGLIMLFFALAHVLNLWVVVIPVIIFTMGGSFIFPQAFSSALMPFAMMAGFANALLGFAQITGGTIASGIMSALPDSSQLPLAIIYLMCGSIALILSAKLSKQY